MSIATEPNPAPVRAPGRALLSAWLDEILPGSRPGRIVRLRGGVDAAMHAVERLDADCAHPSTDLPRWVVLRRYGPQVLSWNPHGPTRLFRTLGVLAAVGAVVPLPLWLDAAGERFGTPAVAMTRLEGRPDVAPRDPLRRAGELARALAQVHALSPAQADLSFLPQIGAGDLLPRTLCDAEVIERSPIPRPELLALKDALAAARQQPMPARRSLLHGDYWAGNVLCAHGAVRAVVDWDQATVGPPAYDVGYCRADLALGFGPEVAAAFLSAYETATGRPLEDLARWDLAGAARAVPDPARWLDGYRDLGRTDLDETIARARWRSFVADALRRA